MLRIGASRRDRASAEDELDLYDSGRHPWEDDRVPTGSERFYLGVGSIFTETVTSKLTVGGRPYVSKLLTSRPENWRKIVELLHRDDLAGVVAKLTGSDYQRMLSHSYRRVADDLLAAIGGVPHLVLVHEAVLGPPLDAALDEEALDQWGDWVNSYGQSEWNDRVAREHFGDMDPEVQAQVNTMFDKHHIAITPYKRNAEASILAANFIDDLQENLIFRIYVPAGRIYEEEISRLLAMFHSWLGAVKGINVRQGGYQTLHGRIIEFFGEGLTRSAGVTTQLVEFNEFLGLIEKPDAARHMLIGLGVDPSRVDDLVNRYIRDARRVLLDARHERDRKMLLIHQRLESELTDLELPISSHVLSQVVHALVPLPNLTLAPNSLPGGYAERGPSVVINTQIVKRVEGVVAQTLNGDIEYGTPVDDLLRLIRSSVDADRAALEDDARQLSDPGAPMQARISARQRIKAFLLRNAARIESSTYNLVWDWLKNQISG